MTSDDVADRIRAGLTGTPEHVANYLNSRAADDMRQLLDEWTAARARYMQARAERLAAEDRAEAYARAIARMQIMGGYR